MQSYVYGGIVSFFTDISVKDFLPEDPTSITFTRADFLVQGTQLALQDTGAAYDTTYYAGATTNTETYRYTIKLKNGVRDTAGYTKHTINADGLGTYYKELVYNNVLDRVYAKIRFTYTYDAANKHLLEMLEEDSLQITKAEITRTVFENFLPTALKKQTYASMQLAPNPAKNTAVLQGAPMGTAILLTNLLGQEVWRGKANQNQTPIPVAGLPPGLYMVRASEQAIRLVVE